MANNELISKIKSIRNGAFFPITYKTELPVKAALKKEGVRVVKVTSVVTRTGVNYDNISYVVKAKATGEIVDSTRTNNYSWVIPNKVAYNSNTNCTYLRIAPVKNGTAHTKYIVTVNGKTKEVSKLDDSIMAMLNKMSGGCTIPVKMIKLDNIISL